MGASHVAFPADLISQHDTGSRRAFGAAVFGNKAFPAGAVFGILPRRAFVDFQKPVARKSAHNESRYLSVPDLNVDVKGW